MSSAWKHYGNAGHLCVANLCRFHLCTEVGEYLVSTVGEYYRDQNNKNMTALGFGKQFYETEVFKWYGRCACGCGLPEIDPSMLEQKRYETPLDANLGHVAMCEKYDDLHSSEMSPGVIIKKVKSIRLNIKDNEGGTKINEEIQV